MFGQIATFANTLLDHLFETDEEKANAKAKLMKAETEGKLATAKVQLSAIIMEAQSKDPWTSRARPSFLYLMYLIILLCVVGGIAGIWWPDEVQTAAQNINALLEALPGEMWWLFGAGYMGYTGARSFDKSRKLKGPSHGG